MMSGTAVLLIVNFFTLVHEDTVHQERSQLAVINTNTQTHNHDLDDEEQTHEQHSTDDILNMKETKLLS